MTVRIAMWSGPRNISTAMMRGFGSRPDCAVTDEPFYGAFLKATGEAQPMAAESIASMDCDWASVAEAMNGPAPGGKPIWYQKHMPHHMVGPVAIDDFPDHRHAFLIRDPGAVVASYAAKNDLRSPERLGYAGLLAYFEREADRLGHAPPVIDSADVLADPEGMLRALCAALDIPWDPAMLVWEPGPRDTDGIWGRHWYAAVERSTGFAPPSAPPALAPDAQRIADACHADYEALARHRLRAAV
ncbi:MAG: sulfotransferase [Sphingomonadaceae bacterium]|nr:sulfotransferase [Sphingomonadaceae bacterium]